MDPLPGKVDAPSAPVNWKAKLSCCKALIDENQDVMWALWSVLRDEDFAAAIFEHNIFYATLEIDVVFPFCLDQRGPTRVTPTWLLFFENDHAIPPP